MWKMKSLGKSRENIKIDIKKHNECKLDLTSWGYSPEAGSEERGSEA